jgi:uncharacterized membrane protein
MKRALEAVSIVALVSMFVALAVVYNRLPDQIPNHFNTGPHPMKMVGKGSLWVLPLISANLFVFLSSASLLVPKRPGASAMPLVIVKAAVMTLMACLYIVRLP